MNEAFTGLEHQKKGGMKIHVFMRSNRWKKMVNVRQINVQLCPTFYTLTYFPYGATLVQ